MAASPPRPPQATPDQPCRTGSDDNDGYLTPQPPLPSSTDHQLANLDTSTLTSPAPGDDQCTRTNGRTWRCPRRRLAGKCFCETHHVANLKRRETTKNRPSSSREKQTGELTAATPIQAKPALLENESTARTVGSCEVGEIWALPDSSGLPRAYARIDRFISAPGPAVLTPLVHHPITDEEIEWAENGRTVACGTFRTSSDSMVVKEITSLKHQVAFPGEGKPKSFFKIFPRTGEVWAVYDGLERGSGYHLAEIVSGFTEDGGVTAARLVAVDGRVGMYRRHFHHQYELLRTFRKEQLLWFSHRVIAVSDGDDDGIGGLWKETSPLAGEKFVGSVLLKGLTLL